MDAKKSLYRKYFPNSRISDADLTVLLDSLAKYYPGKPLKSVFGGMQRDNAFWDRFKAKYPHANVAKFHLDNTDGVRNIYYGDHWAWGETKHSTSAFGMDEVGALGRMSSFPMELTLGSNRYPVPGVSFSESCSDIAGKLVNLDYLSHPNCEFRSKDAKRVYKNCCSLLE